MKSSKSLFSGKQKKIQLKQEKERKQYIRNKQKLEEEEEVIQRMSNPIKYSQSNDLKTILNNNSIFKQDISQYIVPFQTLFSAFTHHICNDIDLSKSDMIEIPIRPSYNEQMTKGEVDNQEEEYFRNYLHNITTICNSSGKQINQFENNLNVWRQLWRVIERSDILLILVDCRWPQYNFPVALYHYITSINKPSLMVLTKVDLVSKEYIDKWIVWFHDKYPNLHIVTHSNMIVDTNQNNCEEKCETILLPNNSHDETHNTNAILEAIKSELLINSHRAEVNNNFSIRVERMSFDPTHHKRLASIAIDEENKFTDITTEHNNRNKIIDSQNVVDKVVDSNLDELWSDNDDDGNGNNRDKRKKKNRKKHVNTRDKIEPQKAHVEPEFMTIGLLGCPNAGKSSFINSLVKKKVVGVSKTPGSTKHLQTIFLNKYTRLCDCPGLVFPSIDYPYPMQVIAGHVNIAQVRETYTTLAYIGARIPLPDMLHISRDGQIVDGKCSNDNEWSGYTIAEAWARQRGYYTSKSTLDTHRAGNEILRNIQSGKLLFVLMPPLVETDDTKK
jgi:ribosome biogenesis GTPase A